MVVGGEKFHRVYNYGQRIFVNIPPAAKTAAVRKHVKMWACSLLPFPLRDEEFAQVQLKWLIIRGQIRGAVLKNVPDRRPRTKQSKKVTING